jgi:hypothetical protein
MVVDFVVALEYYINGNWAQVERFDCAHGYVHRDILTRSGDKGRVVKYLNMIDYGSAINFAIEDYKMNYGVYVWRFING